MMSKQYSAATCNREAGFGDDGLHRLAHENEDLRRRLAEALAAKNRFLAAMSHELRTPLNAVIGFAEIMCEELFGPVGNESYREYVRDIQEAGRALQKRIEELLDLAHWGRLISAGGGADQRLIDLAPDLIAVCRDGRIATINRAGAEMLGVVFTESLVGRRFEDFLETEAAFPGLDVLAAEGLRMVLRLRRFGGRIVEAEAAAVTVPPPDGGEREGVLVVARDVTELRRHLHAVEQERAKAADILATVADGVLTTDAEGRIDNANPAAAALLGYGPDALPGRRLSELLVDRPASCSDDGGRGGLRITNGRRADGTLVPLEVATRCSRRQGAGRCVIAIRDATERLRTEQRLTSLAFSDQVTGLPNRVYLLEHLRHLLARPEGRPVAVIMLDINRFRVLNSLYGASFCDQVLVALAGRLNAVLGGSGLLCRSGNDEFTIVVEGTEQVGDLPLRQLDRVVVEPITQDGHELHLEATTGVATFPNDAADAESLLRNANAAVQHGKRFGGCAVRYSTELGRDARRRAAIEEALRQATGRDELSIHYQARIDLASERAIGAEALMRWSPPSLGPVPPDAFIPVAEATGIILTLGEWLIERLCRDIAALPGGQPLRFSMNLSARQFAQPGLAQWLERCLAENGLSPEAVEVEITEGVLMGDEDTVIGALKRFKDIGISIALDDFGTGYSSLAYLKRFPLDVLKIDKVFVQGMPGDDSDVVIVATIIAMARSLGLEVVAEGIETAGQRRLLLEQGCRIGQGFLYGRPMPMDDFRRFAVPHAAAGAA